MLTRLLRIPTIFLAYAILLTLQKPIFAAVVGGYSFGGCLQAMAHGFAMDMTVAGYFTVIPALLLAAFSFAGRQPKLGIYFALTAIVMAMACVCNAALYPYWNFPLDTTPFFYFFTSPGAAMASAPWWQIALGVVSISVLAVFYWWALRTVWRSKFWTWTPAPKRKLALGLSLLFEAALLFLPIRGGVTVATMNPGRAYFSDDMRLNHAAVNPVFNVLYSATHQKKFASEFRFMLSAEAAAIVDSLYAAPDTAIFSLPYKPNVQVVILESFSSHLFPSLGGEAIAVCLDSIAREGWLFTDIYSSSFRTDRGLPAVLDGFPAQPNTSIAKFADKLGRIPGIASSLREAGYDTRYYYGGDINFANTKAIVMSSGFSECVADVDFPVSQRLSKWGVHDDALFDKAISDLGSASAPQAPYFIAIQTSSSHEPFDVPLSKLADPRANAFAYADSCVADYLRKLESLPGYDKTLVFLVADHYGCYPDLDDPLQRHRIPLIVSGGALKDLPIDTALLRRTGSQTDLAATVLALAGVDHSQFRYSANLLDPSRMPFAFFSEPSWIAMKAGDELAVLSVETSEPMGEASDSLCRQLKAYVQNLYDYIDSK